MCGILGIYNLSSVAPFETGKFRSSLMTMIHRGPDSNQVKVFERKAILGHVRLSIIDISEDNSQPLQVDERYWIVYNGEIYNYIELKDELISAGYSFRTSGDTEVILRAYQHWGAGCVSRFNGMWAFAIYDMSESTLFCSRDRFGVKPFYYAIINGNFIFSSEIKGIISYFPELKKPNYRILSNYCRKSIGAQLKDTWFRDIYRIEPAHNLTICSGEIMHVRYWDYPRKINRDITFEEAKEKYRELLADSVKIRMRSDVPVGFTLSSGLDSSSIVCLLKGSFSGNKNTYTASFPDIHFAKSEKRNFVKDITIDEPGQVKRLTSQLDLKSHIVGIDYSNYLADLKLLIRHLESGHASPAIFPLYQILKEAKRDVTVVLEGQGADELMGGYIIDAFPVFWKGLLKKLMFRKAMEELSSYMDTYSLKMTAKIFIRHSDLKLFKKLYYRLSGIEAFFKGELSKFDELRDFPHKVNDFDDPLNIHLFEAHTGCLVDLLHYGDAIPMALSLESRQPFMDYRLVEFVFTLPFMYKISHGKGKILHREAMRSFVPDEILDNKIKIGFDSPLSELFTREEEGSPKSVLMSERCISRGLFSEKALIKAFNEQREHKKDHSRLLYRLLSVELWFREFID